MRDKFEINGTPKNQTETKVGRRRTQARGWLRSPDLLR